MGTTKGTASLLLYIAALESALCLTHGTSWRTSAPAPLRPATRVYARSLLRSLSQHVSAADQPMWECGIERSLTCVTQAAHSCMSAVPGSLIAGFGSLVDQYDGFILDQFGVMHNGVVALPGAEVCVCAFLAEHEVVCVCMLV